MVDDDLEANRVAKAIQTNVTDVWFCDKQFNTDPTMARLPLSDILHRGLVYSLAGLSVCALVMSVVIHRDTMQRGRGV
jgi:hypothetical protein